MTPDALKGALKAAGRAALSRPPALGLLRRRAHRGGPITVLCYHTLGPDDAVMDAWTVLRAADFRAQIACLRDVYDIVSLDTAQAQGPGTGGRPRAVLTFDDGDIGLHTHLLPLVEDLQIPVTLYIATSQIETGRPYWFDRIMNALQGPGPVTIDTGHADLPVWTVGPTRGAARWTVISDILERLKTLPPQTREDLADRIAAVATTSPATPLAPLSVAQVQELAAHPLVTIGAHSHCHNLLDQIPKEAVRDSATRCRSLLRDWTGQEVAHFAYPNGNSSGMVREVLRDLGFRSATLLDNGLWHRGADAMAVPRLAIGRYDALDRFRLRLVGV